MLAPHESAALAERLIKETCAKQGIAPGQLTLHADRGSSMRSKPVALLLADLGVTKTHSRPHVSNDNPFSEAQFKTLKYCPQFPERFGSIEDGRAFAQMFFRWYNEEHCHSGLGLLTPAVVHFDQAARVRDHRRDVLAGAYAKHPERFVKGRPQPADLPTAVWTNPPVKKPTREDAPRTTIVTSDDLRVDRISAAHGHAAVMMIDCDTTLITSPLVVESRRSAVTCRTGGAKYPQRLSLLRSPRSPSLRFSSPLIEPGVQISRTRLSDGFHVKTYAETNGRTGDRIRETGRPESQTRPGWETAGIHHRPPCAGGGGSDGPCDTRAVSHRVAPWSLNRS
jgi:hypothetical protein